MIFYVFGFFIYIFDLQYTADLSKNVVELNVDFI